MNPSSRPRDPAAPSPVLGQAIDREVRRSKRLLRLFLGLAALPILIIIWVLFFGQSGLQKATEEIGNKTATTLVALSNEVKKAASDLEERVSNNIQTLSATGNSRIQDVSNVVLKAIRQSDSIAGEMANQQRAVQETAVSVRELSKSVQSLSSSLEQSDRSNRVSAAESREWQKRFEAQSQRLIQLEKTAADMASGLKQMDELLRTTKELQQFLQRTTNLNEAAYNLERRLQRLERKAVMTR